MATQVGQQTGNIQLTHDKNADIEAYTAWLKWNVAGGGDREDDWRVNVDHKLDGQPKIKAITIKSSDDVVLKMWGTYPPSGNPARTVSGPTDGEEDIDQVRIGAFRIESQ